MNKKNRSQQRPSGNFASYLAGPKKIDNDDESIASSDLSDIDGEIVKIGSKNGGFTKDSTNTSDTFTRDTNNTRGDYTKDNTFTNDDYTRDSIDLDGLFNTLGGLGGKNTELASLYKTIDEKEREVVHPLHEHQQKKYYRQAAYKTISKEVESWIPQISYIDNKEIITYGKTAPIEVKPHLLASSITPINDFERELAQAESDVKSLQKNVQIDNIQGQNSSELVKPMSKALTHRQNMKNKQLNRIKSKKWHRIKRKGKEFLQEKLISRVELEDPEMAKQIKYEIQIKAAERRLLRKREAQNKWAKMAIRYGGKEARRLASKQSQSLNDYEKNIISLAKKNDLESDDDESEDESDDDESEDESGSDEKAIDEACDVITAIDEKAIENDSEMESKHARVYDMKFMKRARDRAAAASSDQSDEEDCNEKISDEDDCLENAKYSIQDKNTRGKGDKISIQNKYEMIKECIRSAANIESNEESVQSMNNAMNNNGIGRNKSDVVQDIVNQKKELTRIINEVPRSDSNDLVCEIFTGNDEQLLTDSDDDNDIKQITNTNWGKWITKNNHRNNDTDESNIKKRKVRVKVVNDSSKLAKYTIKKLPYPHASVKTFNNTLERPLGPEWNTAKAHKRLIQPKVEIKVGNVIIPIQKKNLGSKREVDSLLRAFGKASRAQRTLARL